MSVTTSGICKSEAATTMDSVINSAEHNQKFALEALDRVKSIRDSLLGGKSIRDSLLGGRPQVDTNKDVSGSSGQLTNLDDTLGRTRDAIQQINSVLTDLERACNLDISEKSDH